MYIYIYIYVWSIAISKINKGVYCSVFKLIMLSTYIRIM